jgi:hypothetical protein
VSQLLLRELIGIDHQAVSDEKSRGLHAGNKALNLMFTLTNAGELPRSALNGLEAFRPSADASEVRSAPFFLSCPAPLCLPLRQILR